MADRPFKNFFAARDALDAEIAAGKLKLKGTKHLVFRIILEHTLYQPDDPGDYGFVVSKFPGAETATGVHGFALVSGASPAAVKDALKSLEHEDKLITRFTRPLVAGGRKADRIRVNWALPEATASSLFRRGAECPTEGPESGPSYQPESGPSEEPESGSSIYRKQEPQYQKLAVEPSNLPAAPEGAADHFSSERQSQTPGGRAPQTPQDPGNTFIFWRAKSGTRKGEWVEYTAARPPRHAPKDAVTVSLSPDEAVYLRQTWPMVAARPPAQRAEFAEDRAGYLLMDPAERTAMVCGTPGNAAEQRDPEERILSYLAGHKELDASSGLPDDLADLGIKTVLDFCESIAWDTGLYGSRDLQTFGLTDEARFRLAPDFPEESVWRRVGGRRFGITEYELAELDEDLGLPKETSRSVLERFTESGDVVKEGSCYRIVS